MDGFIVRRGGTYVQSSGSSSSSSSSQPIYYNGNQMLTELLAGTITELYAPSIGWASEPAYLLNGSVFTSCSTLKTVNFPDAVSVPNAYWFSQIRSCLENVSMAKCETIAYGAFAQCSKLKTVYFPACSQIGVQAFQNCSALQMASFPNCETCSSSAFSGAVNITEIYFPKLQSIVSNAFPLGASFHSLTRLELGVTTMPSTFSRCSTLVEVSLPSCTTIAQYCFASCTSLKYVHLNNCKLIGAQAFTSCSNLTSLYLLGSSVCLLSGAAFASTPIVDSTYLSEGYGSIYVPQSLLASYQSAQFWSEFSSRFVGVDTGA